MTPALLANRAYPVLSFELIALSVICFIAAVLLIVGAYLLIKAANCVEYVEYPADTAEEEEE